MRGCESEWAAAAVAAHDVLAAMHRVEPSSAAACLLRHLPRPASPTPCTQPTCQPSSGAPDTAAMAGVWRPISPSAPSSLARLQKELLRSSRPAASTFSSAGSLRLSGGEAAEQAVNVEHVHMLHNCDVAGHHFPAQGAGACMAVGMEAGR